MPNPLNRTTSAASSFGVPWSWNLGIWAFAPIIAAIVLFATSAASAQSSVALAPDAWPMDVVRTKDGHEYRGLIQAETRFEMEFIEVVRPVGKPMHLVIRPIGVGGIADVERLSEQERKKLVERTNRFRNRLRIEAGRMEEIELDELAIGAASYRRYRGRWFTALSTADDETTRRCIVRIEQIFRAYRQVLPPRQPSLRPLEVRLFASMEEYFGYLERRDIAIRNPSLFLLSENTILAAAELDVFAQRLQAVRDRHEAIRRQYRDLAKELPESLKELSAQMRAKGFSRDKISEAVSAQRAAFNRETATMMTRLQAADRRNSEVFGDVTHAMFRRLYHEAFHAYLENYVYPRQRFAVPTWLNEGMAQVFEGGQLESGTLRIDAPDRRLLTEFQREQHSDAPLPLAELLAGDGGQFLADHDTLDAAARRYYVNAWALVYYLMFLHDDPLTIASLDRYIADRDGSVVERCEAFLGMPLATFARRWRTVMGALSVESKGGNHR
jgi:hypothetical protein